MPLLSNDPDQMTISEHQKRRQNKCGISTGGKEKKYYEFETRTRRLYPKTTESIIYLHFTFILRAMFRTKRKKGHVHVHLIIFATTLFSVHIRFSSIRFRCKKRNNNSNCNKKLQSLFSVFFLCQLRASLFTV